DVPALLDWWRSQTLDVSFLPTPIAELAFAEGAPPKGLRVLLVGGDRLRRLPPWAQSVSIVNNYGPTENTVVASSGQLRSDDTVLHIGRPISNTRIHILDARHEPVPLGVVGEIFIAGSQVARGYLNRPELTAERFIRDPFAEDAGAMMYRTGDLARYLPDGNIEYVDRNDDQVKVRGFRIELGEIETRLSEHPSVRETVVLVREDVRGDKRLVAYVTLVQDTADVAAVLRAHLSSCLPEYMVPAAYVSLQVLPLTANGKLDRRTLPAPEDGAYGRRDYEAPQGEVETRLAEIWTHLLQVERVGRHDNFFELGGHSLLAVRLVERMRQADIHADIQVLFSKPTLLELARAVGAAGAREVEVPPNGIPPGCEAIDPSMLPLAALTGDEIERIVQAVPGGARNIQDIYPLAPLQEGLLYHHLASQMGDAYLMHASIAFESRSKLDRFVEALRAVIARHDTLRTAVMWEGLREPLQVVWRETVLHVQQVQPDDGTTDVAEWLQHRFDSRHHRIDLRRAPPLEAYFAQDESTKRWVLLLLLHHIALDHTGLEIMLDDVGAHLAGVEASLPPAQPLRNYIAQARLGVSEAEHEAFFREMLAEVAEPTLPYGLSDVQGDGSGISEARLPVARDLAARVRAQARSRGISTASVFHLAWAQVLSKLSGRDDVVFGTVLFGRLRAGDGAERALGLLINTLPLRVKLEGVSADQALMSTHRALTGLLLHEHASLTLAQRCSGVAAPAPLFSALMNYRHTRESEFDANSARRWHGIEILASEERTNYPCSLSVDDLGDDFCLTAQVVARIDASRVCAYMHEALSNLVDALEHAPHTGVCDVRVLPESERYELLVERNATMTDYPREHAVHSLFEAQVARAPHASAVMEDERSVSYAELDEHAARIARHLVRAGTRPGDRVAIVLGRSIDLIACEIA
ncbi:MAG TPA: condensation domain-containing protein, partial [Trinickia sp.]|nr:condensation domain-containing protein [Trinickia sp.]